MADYAAAREHRTCRCRNCGYEAPLIFFPAELAKVARVSLRLAQCPRCFSTHMLVGSKAEARADG